jgi:hypothetical protein
MSDLLQMISDVADLLLPYCAGHGLSFILWLRGDAVAAQGIRLCRRVDRTPAEPAAGLLLWISRREQNIKAVRYTPFCCSQPSLQHAPLSIGSHINSPALHGWHRHMGFGMPTFALQVWVSPLANGPSPRTTLIVKLTAAAARPGDPAIHRS